jgi:hypothetical protein
MTTLDERLREAEDALGDPPRVAPPFDALRSRHRQRRRRSMTVGAGALSIVVVCIAVAFAIGDHREQAPAAPTQPSVASTTATTAAPGPAVQSLETMPRFPTSAVRTVTFSRPVGRGVVDDRGALWYVDAPAACNDNCGWISVADLSNGRVSTTKSLPAGQGAGPIAVGDGAVFIATFDYNGSPIRVTRLDIATRQMTFTVNVPGTKFSGNPKARLAFGNGALWFAKGTGPVVKFDPRTGRVLATIPLPHNGAETTGHVGFAFGPSAVWLVGGDSGTTLIRIDPATNRATAATSFAPGFSQSLAADGRYVWTTHFANAQPRARLDLVRVDAADPSKSDITGIPTVQVAAGDGQVWFLGYTPFLGSTPGEARDHYGVVGRIDPETMKVIGVTELDGIGAIDDAQLIVADGSAWVYNASTRAITRITTP